MHLLLDTHLLLWALSSPEKLTKRARQRIESSEVCERRLDLGNQYQVCSRQTRSRSQ
jgi:hypothetical protein